MREMCTLHLAFRPNHTVVTSHVNKFSRNDRLRKPNIGSTTQDLHEIVEKIVFLQLIFFDFFCRYNHPITQIFTALTTLRTGLFLSTPLKAECFPVLQNFNVDASAGVFSQPQPIIPNSGSARWITNTQKRFLWFVNFSNTQKRRFINLISII